MLSYKWTVLYIKVKIWKFLFSNIMINLNLFCFLCGELQRQNKCSVTFTAPAPFQDLNLGTWPPSMALIDLSGISNRHHFSNPPRICDMKLRVPSHEQTQTGLSFRSVWNSFRPTVRALSALTWHRRNETQIDLKLISLSQVSLSFQVDLKFSCEQKIFSFRGEMTFQSTCDWHSSRSCGKQNNKDFIQSHPAGSKCYESMPISSTKQSQLF